MKMQFWSHADAGPLWNCKKCCWILCSSRSGNCGVAFGLAAYSMHFLCEWSCKLFCYKKHRNSWRKNILTGFWFRTVWLKSFLRYGQLVALLSTGYIEAGTRCYFVFSNIVRLNLSHCSAIFQYHVAITIWPIYSFLRPGICSLQEA